MGKFVWLALAAMGCGGQIADGTDGGFVGPDATFDGTSIKPDGSLDAPFTFDVATCSQTTCEGCCDTNGVCLDGKSAKACGKLAHACVDCLAQGLVCAASDSDGGGGTCASGKAVTCNPQSCNGCCQGNVCEPGTDLGACGTGGAACVACPLNAACSTGSCIVETGSCNASNCIGCCIGTTCFAGTDNAACGAAGAKCQNCFGNGSCSRTGPFGGGECSSSVSCQCPSGCCDEFYQCHPGTDALACGSGGSSCGVCENNGACVGNACTLGTCNSQNCAGCCDDFGVCHTTSDLGHCGNDGHRCASCPNGYACQNEVCTPAPACTPQNCAGCCGANGNCTPGTINSACGTGGVACVSCSGATQCLVQTCQ